MRATLFRLIAGSLCCAMVGCGDDPQTTPDDVGADVADASDTSDVADVETDTGDASVDTVIDVAPDAAVTGPTFAFGTDPAQFVSDGPFPSNLYRSPDGIRIGALDRDPVLGARGS